MSRFRNGALVGGVVSVLVLAACTSGVLTLEVGTCFDDPPFAGEGTSNEITVVACDIPHDNEVFANETIVGDEYPGPDVVVDRANEACLAAFPAYVGEPYDTSVYGYTWFAPSPETWEVGDREIICYLYDGSFAKITGSVAGGRA